MYFMDLFRIYLLWLLCGILKIFFPSNILCVVFRDKVLSPRVSIISKLLYFFVLKQNKFGLLNQRPLTQYFVLFFFADTRELFGIYYL